VAVEVAYFHVAVQPQNAQILSPDGGQAFARYRKALSVTPRASLRRLCPYGITTGSDPSRVIDHRVNSLS